MNELNAQKIFLPKLDKFVQKKRDQLWEEFQNFW
jgi:hypothetical protein